MSSRIQHSIRNSSIAIISQIIIVLLSFITRTIFIKTLGAEYLGVNGLFTNILSILSFAELGIGTAIVYAMYKPLAESNEKKVSALMNMYAKAYKIIGAFVAIIGLSIVPVMDYFINDKPNIGNLSYIYILFLINSVISYFFAYKRSLIIASQNSHINTLNQVGFSIFQSIMQIIVLCKFRNYILYLVIQILSTLLSNIAISRKADKMFPYLKENRCEKLDNDSKKSIYKNILAMLCHKLGGIIVTGTDNLLISKFIGVYWVGIYSNYVLIINTIQSLIMQGINSLSASIGNLTAVESNQKSYDIFKKLLFINFVIAILFSTVLSVTINPFISIWLGNEYLAKYSLTIVIIVNFWITQMRQVSIAYIASYGLFWHIKWKSLLEGVINIIASIIFIKYFNLGIIGVILGTITSNILTNVWWEPYVVYKYGFNINITEYLIMYIKYMLTSIILVVINIHICSYLNVSNFLYIVIRGLISTFITFTTIFIVFYKDENLNFAIKLIKGIIVKILGKRLKIS